MRPGLVDELVCIECGGRLQVEVFRREAGLWGGPEIADARLDCACGTAYPVIQGVPRMVAPDFTRSWPTRYPEFFARYGTEFPSGTLQGSRPNAQGTRPNPQCSTLNAQPSPQAVDTRTARSFAYEWERFGELRPEWEANFWGYMAPLTNGDLAGERMLEAGCGSGRHTYHAARAGAQVFAVDLGEAVDVAYRNTAALPDAHVIQADLRRLPFAPAAFDRIMSLGVLHHLPDPEAAFGGLLPYLRSGGEICIYLYWALEHAPLWQRALLGSVTAARYVTSRLPHPCLHVLAYPIAAAAYGAFVIPGRVLSRWRATRRLAEALPLRAYAGYPFRVCVNDQFDRFSAPIEHRYTRAEVLAWLERAGLEAASVRGHFGWVGTGRKGVDARLSAEVEGQVGSGADFLVDVLGRKPAGVGECERDEHLLVGAADRWTGPVAEV